MFMKVLIETLEGNEKFTLSVIQKSNAASRGGNIISYEGIWVAQDENGNQFLDEDSKPIKFNTAAREGVGLFKGKKFKYTIDGYLND